MLEKLLAESKALRERDLVVADRRRLAIMVIKEDVWLSLACSVRAMASLLNFRQVSRGVAKSRVESK